MFGLANLEGKRGVLTGGAHVLRVEAGPANAKVKYVYEFILSSLKVADSWCK
jgi:hypothetical protein